jgi:NADP-dependent 3-hydroxy acid dehydrogenase YdfG/acyl carrier protein
VASETEAGADAGTAARAALDRGLALVQAWLADERFADTRLVVVTERAVRTGAGTEPEPDLATAALWGLLRSACSEHPDRIALVDVDDDEASLQAVPRALVGDEREAAVRAGTVLVPRLTRLRSAPERSGAPAATGPDLTEGTVLVTGGTGTLGRLVARHLATEHGVRHLLLVGRRGPAADGVTELVAELAQLGATVDVTACDVADRDALAALLATVPPERPLTGVVHAAGALADGLVQALTPESLDLVWNPKAAAAQHLHELTRGAPLSLFVFFSSLAGIAGNAGQGNYAAANCFIDALAELRRAQGLPALSLAWGLWEEGSGMTGHLDREDQGRLRRGGVLPLAAEQGLAMLDTALRSTGPAGGEEAPAVVAAARLDAAGLRAQLSAGTLAPLFRGLVRVAERRTTDTVESLAEQLAGLPDAERHARVLDVVRTNVAGVLSRGTEEGIDAERSFKELGFDSLTAVELRNRLSAAAGVRLPATLVFDHPTPGALAAHLLETLAPARPAHASLTAELDRLEQVLASTSDDELRVMISARLRGMLAKWQGESGDSGTVAAVLQSPSTSVGDLFDFIDNELGRGGD